MLSQLIQILFTSILFQNNKFNAPLQSGFLLLGYNKMQTIFLYLQKFSIVIEERRQTNPFQYLDDYQFKNFSFSPWLGKCKYTKGLDDGGNAYILPEGFYTITKDCETIIYSQLDNQCVIGVKQISNTDYLPVLLDDTGAEIALIPMAPTSH